MPRKWLHHWLRERVKDTQVHRGASLLKRYKRIHHSWESDFSDTEIFSSPDFYGLLSESELSIMKKNFLIYSLMTFVKISVDLMAFIPVIKICGLMQFLLQTKWIFRKSANKRIKNPRDITWYHRWAWYPLNIRSEGELNLADTHHTGQLD